MNCAVSDDETLTRRRRRFGVLRPATLALRCVAVESVNGDKTMTGIGWGCIGTGNIASAMGEQLAMLPRAVPVAICSATGRRMDVEQLFGFRKVVENVDQLLAIQEIDIVYVASANTDHARHSIAALRAGKHVLCEKPIAMNEEEAETVISIATRRNLLFMDGTFQAYLPVFKQLSTIIKERGPAQIIQLHKKIKTGLMQQSPLLTSAALGGGIYDGTGSYTAHILVSLMGVNAIGGVRPRHVRVQSASIGKVDWSTTASIDFPSGTQVTLSHLAHDEQRMSKVVFQCGSVEFDLPKLKRVTIDGQPLSNDVQSTERGVHPGLGHEAAHAMELIEKNQIESPLLPHNTSLAMMHVMDLIRVNIPTHVLYKPPSPTSVCESEV